SGQPIGSQSLNADQGFSRPYKVVIDYMCKLSPDRSVDSPIIGAFFDNTTTGFVLTNANIVRTCGITKWVIYFFVNLDVLNFYSRKVPKNLIINGNIGVP